MDKYSKASIKFKLKKLFLCLLFVALISFFIFPRITQAAALTALSDTMSRLADSTPDAVYSNHTIKFTSPSGVASSGKIDITFPAGFTIGSVDYTDIDVSWGPSTGYENELSLAGAPSGSTWGAYFTGQVLTLESGSGTITATSKIVFEIGLNASGGNAQIQNHATAGTYAISIAGTFGDTGTIAIVIISNDQVQLTAAVDPSITFSISANASAFGTLTTGSVTNSSPNITLTVGTTGSGYTVTVRDVGSGSNPGLYNTPAADIIGSTNAAYDDGPTTLVAGTEGMGIYVSANTGSPVIAARYNGGTGTQVGGLEITDTTIISRATPMASDDTATITHRAAIGTFTSPGAYSDILTYIATGNF